jgi:hypothetical protein
MRQAATLLFLFSIIANGVGPANTSTEKSVPASIGLPVGDKAPSFTLRDQFDRAQSNETLKGAKGTILLFFRSADW